MSHVIAPRFIGPAMGGGGYQVDYSCRFYSGDSAYLSRTPGSAGNRRVYTISGWVKRAKLGTLQSLVSAGLTGNDSDYFSLYFNTSDKLVVDERESTTFVTNIVTTAVYRDPSAWLHICLGVDTTQANAADRFTLTVNGSAVSAFDTNTRQGQNTDTWINSTNLHRIGRNANSGGNALADYYSSQMVLIDGSKLAASSFGEFDPHGVWRPKNVTGLTFGTNGFLLDFAASNLGNDVSGNNNDFTSSGLTTDDQMIDTPTDNFATLNPYNKVTSPTQTISDGNLAIASASADFNYSGYAAATITVGANFRPIYLEAKTTAFSNQPPVFGVTRELSIVESASVFQYDASKTKISVLASSTTSIRQMAYDPSTGNIWFGTDGVWDSGDPATGTSPSGTMAAPVVVIIGPFLNAGGSFGNGKINFGQQPFSYTPPSGFKALSTANLPKPPSAGSVTPITGSFTGNTIADGPFVWLGYTPDTAATSTINGNTITWGTHANATAGGLKIITSSSSYNASGSNSYSIAVAHPFGGKKTTPATAR